MDALLNIARAQVGTGGFQIIWSISIGQIIMIATATLGFVSATGALIANVRSHSKDIHTLRKDVDALKKERHEETKAISEDLLQFRKETLANFETMREMISEITQGLKK